MPKRVTKEELDDEQAQQVSNMLESSPEQTSKVEQEKVEQEEQEREEEQEEQPREEEEQQDEEVEETEEEQTAEEQEEAEGDEEEETGPQDTIDRLRQRIEEISSDAATDTVQKAKGEEVEEEESPEEDSSAREQLEEKGVDIEEEVRNLMSDEQFEKIQTDPQAFNDFLAQFAETIVNRTRQAAMQDIPRIVQETAQRQTSINQKITQFYSDNEDLQPYRKYVGYTFNEIKAENPDMDLDDALDETASRVRKDLDLTEEARSREKEEREKESKSEDQPAFARGSKGGGRRGAEDTRGEKQKQIDNILNLE